jgi:hypothetical protein
MDTHLEQAEEQHGAACEQGCCDPESQPPFFNRYTLIGMTALAALFGGVALIQALSG